MLNWRSVFLTTHSITGFGLATNLQALQMEEADYLLPEEGGLLKEHGAEHQLKTTMDYAMEGRPITWPIGGLDHQVVHHLFPNICHVYYPKLSKNNSNYFGQVYSPF